jgi:TolB protein
MRQALFVLFLLATGACTSAVDSAAPPAASTEEVLRSLITFSSTRNDPNGDLLSATEVYVMNGDTTDLLRLTTNTHGDLSPALSPDGRRIVFESNRLRSGAEPRNVADLFLMNADGTDPVLLVRGSSATWSPDGQRIAFHASASGNGTPLSGEPGAAASDSDIFVINIAELINSAAAPVNVTHNAATIDTDPHWSPDGQTLVFTSHPVSDGDATGAEIYVIRADGTGPPRRLTTNTEEERAPSWSPDGQRIAFCCRSGGTDFEICVMNADGSGLTRITNNAVADLNPAWSPDGTQIVFHKAVAGRATFELCLMNADGSQQVQLTDTPGQNAFPSWAAVPTRANTP